MKGLIEKLQLYRILPAAVIADLSHAIPLAKAFLEAGLPMMEVTLRNECALDCIRDIASEVPGMHLGAGTLLTPRQVDQACDAGARFGLTPGFNPSLIRHAIDRGFPLIPGVLTPGEMEQALELGCEVVKFFPASAAGGVDFIRAVTSPYRHTNLRLLPLGGISEKNMLDYLDLPLVIAVGGSWLADQRLAESRKWGEISALTRSALKTASQMKLEQV